MGGSLKPNKEQTQQQQSIPAWLETAMQYNVDQGQQLASREYTPYEGQRQAEFNPLQSEAYGSANYFGGMAPESFQNAFGFLNDTTGQDMMGGAYAGMAGMLGPGGMPGYRPAGDAAQADLANRGNIRDVQGGSFLDMDRDAYTNQYTQGVSDNVLSDISRMADQQQNQIAGQAAASGAFGGSRHGVQDAINLSEAQRNYGQISNQLNSQAFDAASGLMGSDLERGLLAGQLNQGADSLIEQLNTGVGQFNAGAQNSMAQFDAANRLQSDQFGIGSRAGLLANMGNLGQMTGNQNLAQGQALQGFGQAGMGAQEMAGNNIMGMDQANLSQMYNDFVEARDWGANNNRYLSVGMPTQSAGGTTTQDVFQPSAGQQMLGAATALGGAALSGGK
jgi:hypothetical protein